MAKKHFITLCIALLGLVIAPSCKAKYGCPANESLAPKTNKKGEIKKSSSSKSNLFPKKMRKKMGKS